MLRIALAFALAHMAVVLSVAEDRDVQRESLLGKVPPEIVGAKENWFRGPATTLAGLKGNVVWL